MHIASIGIDLGKTTFHLVALGEHDKVLIRKKFSRAQLLAYTANLPSSLIGVNSIAMDPQGVYFWVTDSFCFSGCSMTTDTWKLNTTTGVPAYLESGIAGCALLARSDPSGKF